MAKSQERHAEIQELYAILASMQGNKYLTFESNA